MYKVISQKVSWQFVHCYNDRWGLYFIHDETVNADQKEKKGNKDRKNQPIENKDAKLFLYCGTFTLEYA
jgi:hypothetical protein